VARLLGNRRKIDAAQAEFDGEQPLVVMDGSLPGQNNELIASCAKMRLIP
jgi:hypothetical protein